MIESQSLKNIKSNNIDYIQKINDISAILYISIICALPSTYWYIDITAQMFFCIMTIINSYLKGKKTNVVLLWGGIFYGYCLVSSLWAYSASGASRFVTVITEIIILFITISLYADNKKNIETALKAVLIGTAILFFRLLINTPFDQWGVDRLGGSINTNENTVGMIFAYASTICLYRSERNKIYYIAYFLFSAMSILSGSRKALIIVLLVIVLYNIDKMNKPSNVVYIIPFGVVFYFIIYYCNNNPLLYQLIGRRMEYLFNYFTGEGEIGESTSVRMELIDIGIYQFKEHVLIGHGLNSFRYMNKYELYAHNNYIEILVNNGIIGAILYYAMHIFIFVKASIKWLKNMRESFLAIVLITMIMIGDYGVVSYYNPLTVVLLVLSYYMVGLSEGKPLINNKKEALKTA